MTFDDSQRIVVASTDLATLFSGGRIRADGGDIAGELHLPEYQRPYRWDDRLVLGLYEDLLAHFAADRRAPHDFYLGTIILHQTGSADGPQLDIIDGQQRLASMMQLCWLAGIKPLPRLRFRAPESQQRIIANLAALRGRIAPVFTLARINVTLVVTDSEDDAYRFFETQNSGGVRLSGADIIKAHHLRAIEPQRQDDHARRWEEMGDLAVVLETVMRARHWQTLAWRDLASHRKPLLAREQVVHELAALTGESGLDEAYRQVRIRRTDEGWETAGACGGYLLRQPLAAGTNSINYLRQFDELHRDWCGKGASAGRTTYHHYYRHLVADTDTSVFLKRYYDCTLAMYISQFGTSQLLEASLWLFRLVFSPRLSNEKMVRESSVQSFARRVPVLDWIASSFTHHQVMIHLRGFDYTVSTEHLDKPNGAKRRFADGVIASLQLTLPQQGDYGSMLATSFDAALQEAIDTIVRNDAISPREAA